MLRWLAHVAVCGFGPYLWLAGVNHLPVARDLDAIQGGAHEDMYIHVNSRV